jgi:hypothetical protein
MLKLQLSELQIIFKRQTKLLWSLGAQSEAQLNSTQLAPHNNILIQVNLGYNVKHNFIATTIHTIWKTVTTNNTRAPPLII